MSADNESTQTQKAILRGGSFVAGIPVRVLKGESHHLSAQVTQNPLENGDNLSEHMSRTPNYVDVIFEMTNTSDIAYGANSLVGPAAIVPYSEDGVSAAITVAQQFNKMIDDRTIITLETEHFRYRNMVVASFTPNHRAPYKGAYSATIRLQQVGVTGITDSVSIQGGRPRGVLAKDTTKKTAVAQTKGGVIPAITSGPELEQALSVLRSYSLV